MALGLILVSNVLFDSGLTNGLYGVEKVRTMFTKPKRAYIKDIVSDFHGADVRVGGDIAGDKDEGLRGNNF